MMNRRYFLNFVLGGGFIAWMAAMFYPTIKFLIPPEQTEPEPDTVKLGPVKDFPPGSSKIFRFGKKPVIFIHAKSGEFHALIATCTHLDCLVQYRADMEDIWCACHNGKYDLSGRNISGPPPKPLENFKVRIIKGDIIVAKSV